MSWFHQHKWEIVAADHVTDYEHYECFEHDPYTLDRRRKVVTMEGGRKVLWGKQVTVYTLQCKDCGDIKSRQVDGWQEKCEEDWDKK